jgi:aminopeptidase-like protein/aminoglycoside N3'-acetyltransferase
MTLAGGDYSWERLATALRVAGLSQGDVAFVHVDLDRLGAPAGAEPEFSRERMLYETLRALLGPEGTLIVPTYTFSFCRGEPFDVQGSATSGGPWSPTAAFLEYVRCRPGAVRSADPIHSVAGVGPRAAELLHGTAATCFGPGSVFERLRQAGSKICMIGLDLDEATLRHHSEELAGVPFRYKKLFTGVITDGGVSRKRGWLYNVRLLADNAYPDGTRLAALARATEVCRSAAVGRGEVLIAHASEYHELTLKCLRADPWFTARGPAGDPVQLEALRLGVPPLTVDLPANASGREMVESLWRLPRHIVSDGYDAALLALARQVPMTVHEYPSGQEAWTWVVPEKWTCREAYLERLNGERLLSLDDNPLHVVSSSLPFDGEVTREELFDHLHVHPRLPDAIPFVFKYYEKDWGLCCSARMRERLTEDRYRVVIRSEFSYGTLKVGEVVVPGRTDDCFVLCAHLCHPAMVNDDLSGVVVGMEVMRALLRRRDLHYTYRLLILPETIGSIAYLAAHPDVIPSMRGGVFLEMLALDQPHALQLSLAGDSRVDRAATAGLRRRDPDGWTTPFRSLMGNDERQFNAPGVRVPMVSLTRMLPPAHPEHPYREYHASEDTPERAALDRLEESRDVVLDIIDELECQRVPVNRFQGEVFCSRYGLHIDPFENAEAHRALFDIMYLIDGSRTIDDIALQCGASTSAVRSVVTELERHGLVTW